MSLGFSLLSLYLNNTKHKGYEKDCVNDRFIRVDFSVHNHDSFPSS